MARASEQEDLPKTECLLSSHGVGTVVTKNWEPLVFGPALAMDRVKGRSCRSDRWNSSSNSDPQMEVPPVPSPSGSPVTIARAQTQKSRASLSAQPRGRQLRCWTDAA